MSFIQIQCFKCRKGISIDTSMFQDSITKKMDCPFCGIDVFIKLNLVYGPSPEHIVNYEKAVASYINYRAYGYSLEPQVKDFIDNLIKGVENG